MTKIEPPYAVWELLASSLDLPDEEWAKRLAKSLSAAEMIELITYGVRLRLLDLSMSALLQVTEHPVSTQMHDTQSANPRLQPIMH